jgi:PAS domain-containing protein
MAKPASAERSMAGRFPEQHYRELFDSIDQGFCTIEVLFDRDGKASDYRFLDVNHAFEEQTGLRDAVGRRMRELAPAHEEHWFETYGNVAQRHVAVLFSDVTARKAAEIALSAAPGPHGGRPSRHRPNYARRNRPSEGTD